jgi:hypothetical protein
MRRTSSALFRFEQTVGVDISLERRPERLPGGLGRLARVVGRVESVCTDPSAKGPTGPFCLVHLQMLPRTSVALTGGSTVAPALLESEPSLDRRDVARLATPPARPRLGPRSGGVTRTV